MRAHIICFSMLCFSAFSQLENANWHFGIRCGLNFQNTAPVVVNSHINSNATSTSISDSLGNLLFYVREGDLVYNKNHDTMANGHSIGNGGFSGSWAIIKKNAMQYYIINNNSALYLQPQPFPPMITYAIVDMSFAAGMGSVVAINQPISASGIPMVSKIAATKHCNGKDHWLMCHVGGSPPGSTQYIAYLVSSNGISSTPVISNIGSNQFQSLALFDYAGEHKFSPNGRKLAAAMPDRTIELYDFNPSTGQLSNVIKLDSLATPTTTNFILEQATRSVEFSPDGSKLYVSYVNQHPLICQFDLSLPTASAIAASKMVIDSQFSTTNMRYRLQLAPNGKIYAANGNTLSIGVINSPNAFGLSCNYQPVAVYIGTTATFPHTAYVTASLPFFMTYNLENKPSLPLPSSLVCGVANFLPPTLYPLIGYSVSSYYWNFNDALSGANTSTINNPVHQFSANGTYTVKLALNYHPCGTDTLKQVLIITGLPELLVSGKTSICKGESTVLNFSGANSYTLNTTTLAQTTTQLQPTITTVYTITAKDSSSGCSSLKTVTVSVLPCLGLNKNNLPDGLKLFPNPNSGVFTFETPDAFEIKILNSLGQEVYKTSLSPGSSEINISKEPKGIYLLEWYTKKSKGQLKIVLE